MYRVNINPRPFLHVSLDPLGGIRVTGSGVHYQRIYPLIMCCINSGAVHIESMSGLEARDVYLAILRVQYRYNIRIVQIFSDKGSQLSSAILGRRCDFYTKTLHGLWNIYNNVGYSQWKNIVE